MQKHDPIRLLLKLSYKPDMQYQFIMAREVSGYKSSFFFTEREFEAFTQSIVDLSTIRDKLFDGTANQLVQTIDEVNPLLGDS